MPNPTWTDLQLPGADVRLLPGFLDPAAADALYAELFRGTSWRQDQITIWGKTHPLPRLQQWHADRAAAYKWSGIRMTPEPWTPCLLGVKALVEAATGATYNSVLLNLYRDGRDHVSWHEDAEPGLLPGAPIASVSLGVARDFQLRPTAGGPIVTVPLPPGSLLVMGGRTQETWRHALPKRLAVGGGRINLTFRTMR